MWATAFDCGSVDTQYFGRTVLNTIYIIIDVHNLKRSSYYYGRPRIVVAGVYIYHIIIVIIIIHCLSPSSGLREDIFARQFLFSKTEQSRGVPNDDKSTFDDYYVRTIHNTTYIYIYMKKYHRRASLTWRASDVDDDIISYIIIICGDRHRRRRWSVFGNHFPNAVHRVDKNHVQYSLGRRYFSFLTSPLYNIG